MGIVSGYIYAKVRVTVTDRRGANSSLVIKKACENALKNN